MTKMLVASVLALTAVLGAETVPVKQPDGALHGFLVLRAMQGATLADGDLIQTVRGDRVTTRVVFNFKDGSVRDETGVFSQGQQFRFVSSHLVEKGPTFPQPIDMSIDAQSGQVDVRYTDDHGTAQRDSEHMKLPPDLANGMLLVLLRNITPERHPKEFSYIAATPKPRLVKLALSTTGSDKFETNGRPRSAIHYVLHVDIGGISGLLAPLLGKEPPDSHVWILGGESPAFVKAQQQLYFGGPMVRIELQSPQGP